MLSLAPLYKLGWGEVDQQLFEISILTCLKPRICSQMVLLSIVKYSQETGAYVPWTAKRSNQSILKEIINPEHSLERLMLKLKLQYFGHLLQRANSLEKTLMLRKIEGRIEKGMTEGGMVGWHQQLHGHEFEQTLRDSEGQESLAGCSPGGHRVRHYLATRPINVSEYT